jgi:hypothetical protein
MAVEGHCSSLIFVLCRLFDLVELVLALNMHEIFTTGRQAKNIKVITLFIYLFIYFHCTVF